MRVRTDVLLGLVLLGTIVFGLVLSMLGVQPTRKQQDTRTSTLLPGADGSQGVYETLAELGLPVRRRRTAFFELNEERSPVAVLAVVAPRAMLLTEELSEVVRFVRGGGVLIAVGDAGGIAPCVGFEAPRADSGWVSDGLFGTNGREHHVESVAGLDLPPVRRVLRPWQPLKEAARERRSYERAGCDAIAIASEDTLLRVADGRAVVMDIRLEGKKNAAGRIVLVAEPDYFRNRTWKETSVPYFLVPLLTPQRRGAVVWDEYHQGFEQESAANAALWQWVKGTPFGWALLQIVAVVLVWIAVTAVRFGPALAVIERRRRSPLEHVDALAAGLEGADGSGTAVDLVIGGLRRRLSRAGQPPSSDIGAWLESLQLALPTSRGRAAAQELRRLWLQPAGRTGREPGGAERVLAVAQAVEDVWQDLKPRST
jgi:hypothetical protein